MPKTGFDEHSFFMRLTILFPNLPSFIDMLLDKIIWDSSLRSESCGDIVLLDKKSP